MKKAKDGNGIQVTVPDNRDLVPTGWCMVFVTGRQGTPVRALVGEGALSRWRRPSDVRVPSSLRAPVTAVLL